MRDPFGGVYGDRRVLVTGHTGFKGSWLSLWLHRLGSRVSGLALEPPTNPSMYEACALDGLVDSTIADVRDPDAVAAVLTRVSPEVVFHLAAQPIVRASYDQPVATYDTNVMGTVNVLEAARHSASVRAVVVVTSDKCYENREWDRGYRESDPLGGRDPYSSSKACAELVASAYAHSFFGAEGARAAVATARAGNVVGGGDWGVDRLVPDAVRALSASGEIGVRNPASVRPWQHVLEPIRGYLMLAARLLESGPGPAGTWNFGPDDGDLHRVSEVVERFVAAWGSGGWKDMSSDTAPHEAHVLALNSGKARQELGWRPVLDLGQSLRLAAEWYKCFYADGDVGALTHEQIDAYEAMTQGVTREMPLL